jgi:hypothetical protein
VAEHASSLLLRAYVDRVEITDGARVLATHLRCHGREQDILDVFHYLPLLKERPGALDHARPLKTWAHPPILDCYLAELRDRLPPRAATLELLRVVEMCHEHSPEAVCHAVEQAIASRSLGGDTVAYFLGSGAAMSLRPGTGPAPVRPSSQEVRLWPGTC